MSLNSGYCPSLHPEKKFRILRSVSMAVRNSTSEGRSICENGLRRGTRNGILSGYPDVGKEVSNIRITRISSVRPRRRSISGRILRDSLVPGPVPAVSGRTAVHNGLTDLVEGKLAFDLWCIGHDDWR